MEMNEILVVQDGKKLTPKEDEWEQIILEEKKCTKPTRRSHIIDVEWQRDHFE